MQSEQIKRNEEIIDAIFESLQQIILNEFSKKEDADGEQ